MKKSALALAVAAGLVGFGSAAYADTTLYGSARVSVDYDEWDSDYVELNGELLRIRGGSDAWDVYNNASRLGVRGEEDLGGGLSAIYQYEFGVDVTEGGNLNSNRPKWVGLRGNSWGSVTAGTQWTPYYNVVGIGDIFNSSKVFDNRTYLGNTFGLRMDNSLIYSSPNWSGFGFQAMLVMNGSCPPSDPQVTSDLCTRPGAADNRLPSNLSNDIDMWNLSMSYKNGPFFAGATYMALEGPSFDTVLPTAPNWDGDQWAVAFGYNSGPFAVTLAYEQGDVNTLYRGDGENIYVTGQYTFGNNVIRGSYGYTTADDGQYDGLLADGTLVRYTQSDV
ncbi:MAG: outer membrane protein (porin), partial [Proteobacteria bacterium]|nr:outer membrane protein (porin) [Pseudomonadota bacterium]